MIKFIRSIIFILIFVLPFFVSVKNFFPMVFTKSLLVEGAVLIVGLIFLIYKIYHKDDSNSKIPINIGLLSFSFYLFSVLMSTAASVLPGLSFWGTMDHGTGTIYILSIFIFFIISTVVFKTLDDWKKVFTVFVSSGILYTTCTLLTLLGVNFSKIINITAAGGFTIGNSSWTGMYMSFVFFIALGLFISGKNNLQKSIGAFGLITSFLDPTLTSILFQAPGASFGLIGLARAGSYSLILGLFLIGLYFVFRKINSDKWKNIFIWSVVSSFVLGLILVFTVWFNPIKQFVFENAGGNRFIFWDISVKGLLEKPVLGWGGDTYQYIYGKYFNPIVLTSGYAPEFWVDRSHNIYFDELAMGGILGLASLLFLYGVILWGLLSSAISSKNKDGFLFIAILSGVTSFLIQGLMIFQNSVGWFLITLILAFVSSVSFSDIFIKKDNIQKKIKKPVEDLNIFWAGLSVLSFCVLFYFVVIVPYNVNRKLAQFPLMSYSNRLNFYKYLDDQYLGNTIDMGSFMSQYHIRLRKIHKNGMNDEQKKMMLNEIKQINILIDNSLKRQHYMDVKLLMSGVGMNSIAVAIAPDNEKNELYNKGLSYVDRMYQISDKNPINNSAKLLLDSSFQYGEEGLNILDLDKVKK